MWNRFVRRGDCVRSRQMIEELLVLFGSECPKSERQDPRCVILVRESEKSRDTQSVGGSVRDARFEPRCVFLLMQQEYRDVCVLRGMRSENRSNNQHVFVQISRWDTRDVSWTLFCLHTGSHWSLRRKCVF